MKNLPETPGVYKMKDQKSQVIYVGKAKNLRKRVQTYFRPEYEHSSRTRKLLEQTVDIEYTETDSELEALLLETNLIKELRPRYNILMKDDKSYVYIKVDLTEDFPRIRVVRERELMKTGRKPGVKYFGPKLASSKVYETLRILKKLFPFRHCNLDIKWRDKKRVDVTNRVIDYPCLDYFIKRCPGPCISAIAPIEYKKIIQQILDFLSGKSEDLEHSLKAQMAEAASQKLFEKAGRIRDKLFALQEITERQKITDPERKDTDIINFVTDLGHVYFNVFMIRGGKLMNQENFTLDALELSQTKSLADEVAPSGRNNRLALLRLGLDEEILESFLAQYYEKASDIPKEILVPTELSSKETLEDWLAKERGNTVSILYPKKGEKNKLLELSLKNAGSFAKQYRIKWLAEQRGETALARLAEVLNMKDKPLKRIEGFDISHLGGNETVGSMVVFENGAPKSSDYRHFKIRTVSGKPDDYRCMEEVLMRRLKYLASKKADFTFRKPSKKLFAQIEKIIDSEPARLESGDLHDKTFISLLKDKNLIGFVRLIPISETSAEIKSLWIDQKHRGQKLGFELLRRIIEKSKFKKFYVYVKNEIEAYYAEFGFQTVKEIPKIMAEKIAETARKCREEGILMVMEKKRMAYDDPSFSAKPNLIVIDGGKGQLSTALLALKRLKLEIPVIALAKRLEEIFLPNEKAPLLLEEGDEALKLLQRIRNESHRFAITFQRDLHRTKLLHA